MQPAPAVSFFCDDGGRWRALRAALAALATGAGTAWVLRWGGAVGVMAALGTAAAAGLAGGACWRRCGREPRGRLSWDGSMWRWHAFDPGQDAVVLQRVEVAVDAGGWMLLRLHGAGGGRRPGWCAVHGASGAVRAALFARAGAAPHAAEPPTAA